MIELGDEDYGMLWAPDVLYDRNRDDYVIHWSSSHASNNYGHKAIFYTRTKDFMHFDKPQLLCRKDGSGIIDSAIYEENGTYYRFAKHENPIHIILEQGESITVNTLKIMLSKKRWSNSGIASMRAPLHSSSRMGDAFYAGLLRCAR